MSEQIDQDFYIRSEALERKLAARATDPKIAALHGQLANEYAAKVLKADDQVTRFMI